MLIEDIDLAALEERSAPDRWGKNDPTLDRRTFFSPKRQLYFKIWSPRYLAHRQFFSGTALWVADTKTIFGFDVGFFSAENSGALVEFITDKDGFVRGYVTRAGIPLPDTENPLMESFIEQLKIATERSGFVHTDVCYNNLILMDDRISFIDFDTMFADLSRLDVKFENRMGSLRPHVMSRYSAWITEFVGRRQITPAPLHDALPVDARNLPIRLIGHFVRGVLKPVADEEDFADSFDEIFVPHVGWLTHGARDPTANAIREGHYESVEQAFCWIFLRDGDAMLDFGSLFGLFAVLAGRATNNTGRIIAIERNQKLLPLIRENVKQNGIAGVETKDVASSEAVQLARIDRRRAWSQLLDDRWEAVRLRRWPVIMFTSGEFAPESDNEMEAGIFERLRSAGYVLAWLDPQTLRLFPIKPGDSLARRALFATLDLKETNLKLQEATSDRIRIARDVLRRGSSGDRLRDLEELDALRIKADESDKSQKWAQETQAQLKAEKQVSRELHKWAETAQAKLEEERKLSQELRRWADSAEARFAEERRLTEQLRARLQEAEFLSLSDSKPKIEK